MTQRFQRSAAMAFALALSAPAWAQDTAAPATEAPAATTEETAAATPARDVTAETVVATVDGKDITLGHMILIRQSLPQVFEGLRSQGVSGPYRAQ